MPGRLIPSTSNSETALTQYAAAPPTWAGEMPDDEAEGVHWERYISALKRYKWVMLGTVIVGTLIGIIATRFIKPLYVARSTIWVAGASASVDQNRGPIRAEELLSSYGWVELIRSFAVVDRVVDRLALYVTPEQPGDTAVFRDFKRTPALRAGKYELSVDGLGRGYVLADASGGVIERGTVGDSIGGKVGFLWAPDSSLLRRDRSIEFTVVTPRGAAGSLLSNFEVNLPEKSNFMRLMLTGDQPAPAARTLNALMEEFTITAEELKKRNLTEFARILGSQLDVAASALRRAEGSLEGYRVRTITLPSENSPVPSGLAETRNPALDAFFTERVAQDNTRRDREALERAVRESPQGGASLVNALWGLPSVLEAVPELRTALTEVYATQAKLSAQRQLYTDEHKSVKDLLVNLQVVQTQTLPALARSALDRMQRRETELNRRIAGASTELSKMPSRSIEENRLRREVSVTENLYGTLKDRYESAKLAEASAIPDVTVLDWALGAAPPAKSRAPLIILVAFAGSLVLGAGIALGADRLDRRFRYPEQATQDLGLDVLGAVPSMDKSLQQITDPDSAAQVVEAFRAIRLQLSHALVSAEPLALTISSPGEGDGKTTVASNLALSFAEAGYRTLLIDGDARLGQLHTIFGVTRRPGLIDYLLGTARLDDVLRSGSFHPNLSLLVSGIRRHRGPELLASEEMPRLISALRSRFDVIIVDSPPLAAGIDPFALAVSTGNMILVLRTGTTDRHLAHAKLQLLGKLPIRVLGAVLNDIQATGAYKHYSYLSGYYATEEEEALAAPVRGETVSSST